MLRVWLTIRYPLLIVATGLFLWALNELTVPPQMPERWASLKQVHAVWDGPSNSLYLLHVDVKKRLNCGRTWVIKDMRPIEQGTVGPLVPIVLEGTLWRKVQEMGPGEEEVLWDRARPAGNRHPAPGDYLLTITMLCERQTDGATVVVPATDGTRELQSQPSPTALATEPYRTTITVSSRPAFARMDPGYGS